MYPAPYHDCPLARKVGAYAWWHHQADGMMVPHMFATETDVLAHVREHYPRAVFQLTPVRAVIEVWPHGDVVCIAVIDADTRAMHGVVVGGICPPETVIPPGHGTQCVAFDRKRWAPFEVALKTQN